MPRRKTPRRTWQDSWAFLKQHGVTLPEDEGGTPDVGSRPRAGEAGFRGLAVRGRVFEEVDFEDLCLVRTLFEGCRFHGVSFRNTDLSLCCLQGCEWIDCDFTAAELISADLREAAFFTCRFTRSVLTGADLRDARLESCTFTRANLTGACLAYPLKDALRLSPLQRDFMVDWRQDGDEGPDDEVPDDEED